MTGDPIVCGYCGAPGPEMHRDHLIPRSRGGGDEPDNCVMACPPCNRAKSDSSPSEWMPTGLPDVIYERERRLAKRYAMTPKVRARDRGGWKFDERATAAVLRVASALETRNEPPAGVADGLFDVGRAIRQLARVIARGQCVATGHEWEERHAPNERGLKKCRWCDRWERMP